jgi:hypothetical protein
MAWWSSSTGSWLRARPRAGPRLSNVPWPGNVRRQIAARDAAILAEADADPDMDNLADYAARAPLDVD